MNQQTSEQSAEASGDKAAPRPAQPSGKPVNRVRRITVAVLVALFILFLYHLASDRVMPYTSLGVVETFLVPVAPQVSGRVISVEVADNQTVSQGQVLFRLDPEPFGIAVRAAEAALDVAGQSVGASTAQVAAAQAKVAERRAYLQNVRVQYARVLPLVERGVLPKARGDDARGELATAESKLENAEAELERARQELGPQGAENPQIRAAMATLEKARLDLLYATVVAPSDGLVTNLRLSVGQYAKRGAPVMTFLDVRSIWLTAHMREKQLGNIGPGDVAEVALDVHPGRIFKGRVTGVGWGVSTGTEASAGGLPKPQESKGWLRDPRRFPVRIELDLEPGGVSETGIEGIRLGSQAGIIVYTRPGSILNPLGWLWIRLVTMLAYVY